MIAALAGGVGGAKLADGLARLLGDKLSVIVNTGDDFEHLGLAISPDLDTVTYTLAGIANPETGWGVAGESWNALDQVAKLGGPGWFRLGDKDIALHLVRSQRLRRGENLTAVTADICARLGIAARILPMTDDSVHTLVDTAEGPLAFQDYFVARRCEIPVTGFRFAGIADAKPSPAVVSVLNDRTLDAVMICPSNPFVSVDPILGLPGLRDLLVQRTCPLLAVSPIIGGTAVKGPAAKMMRELGLDVSATSVAGHYRGLIDGLVIDTADAGLAGTIEAMGIKTLVTPTLMKTAEDRTVLAQSCLDFAAALRR